LKSQREVGGLTHKINAIAVFTIFLYNFLDQIVKGQNMLHYLPYTLPLILVSVLFLFVKNKYFISIVYYLIGAFILIDKGNVSDFSSSIFFIFSFHLIQKNYYAIILYISTFVLLTVRFMFFNGTIANTMSMVFIFTYIYLIYYFLIYKTQQTKHHKTYIDIIDITAEEKAILRLYCRGREYQNISETLSLGITGKTVRRRITAVMVKNNIANDAQLGKWLHQKV